MVRVRSEHPRGGAAARRLRARARRFLAALGRPRAELSILIVGDAAIRRINRRWRGVARATDVLSFPAAPPPPRARGAAAGGLLGDVVISLDTASRRTRAAGRPLPAELDRYLAHGILHLLGFDHQRPRQAREMAAREQALLGEEGMVSFDFARPFGPRCAQDERSTDTKSRSRPLDPARPFDELRGSLRSGRTAPKRSR